MYLSNQELQRYARHLSLEEIGLSGQKKIMAAKVLIVGIGGLGCSAAMYLAAAGVGSLGLVDNDSVEESNLHRQLLFNTLDIGRPKVEVAFEKLKLLAAQIDIKTFAEPLDLENAHQIISQFDIVIDGTDNLASKYVLNDVCALLAKPLIYASINQFKGQLAVFENTSKILDSINYRDLFPFPPPAHLLPSCSEAGVVGMLPGLFGCMQANEAIKLLCNIPSGLSEKLLCFDAITMHMQLIGLKKDPNNPLRRFGFTLSHLKDLHKTCGEHEAFSLDIPTFLSWLSSDRVFQLIDVRTILERQQINYGGLHLPLDQLKMTASQWIADIPVVFYCASGKRSVTACRYMADIGINGPCYSLVDGIEGLWNHTIFPEQLASYFNKEGVFTRINLAQDKH